MERGNSRPYINLTSYSQTIYKSNLIFANCPIAGIQQTFKKDHHNSRIQEKRRLKVAKAQTVDTSKTIAMNPECTWRGEIADHI